MRTAGVDRSQVVRLLLVCILFSLFACGLHHGQMSAADLLGTEAGRADPHQVLQAEPEDHPDLVHDLVHDLAHGVGSGHAHGAHGDGHFPDSAAELAPHSVGHAGHEDHQLTPAFSCPLCSSFGAVLAVNSRAWALPPVARESLSISVTRAEPEGPLRAPWNSLNPRAPPGPSRS